MHRTVIERVRGQLVAIVLGLSLVAATAAAPAASEPRAAVSSIGFEAEAGLTSTAVPCPADVPPNATECRTHILIGSLSLGSSPRTSWLSATTYILPLAVGSPTCPAGLGKPLATAGRLAVEGKGEITFTLAEGTRCVGSDAWNESQELTITGGTGAFAAASGTAAVERFVDELWGTDDWAEAWTGALTAPGLHFALPQLTGAVAKTVRAAKGAKRARVTFDVTAIDDLGVEIPVSCYPSSGSRFRVGKTNVLCLATDSSGNTASAGFAVTVKRRR
jgi:hypothetical protein